MNELNQSKDLSNEPVTGEPEQTAAFRYLYLLMRIFLLLSLKLKKTKKENL